MLNDASAYEILRAIRKMLRKTAENSRQIARQSGLNLPQLLCLRAIADGDGHITAAQVSQKVQVSAPTASRILDRMEQDGLILRVRTSSDRRKLSLSLTPSGRQLLEGLPPSLHDRFLQRLQGLDVDERTRLLDALNNLVDLLDAADVDASPLLTTDTDAAAVPPSSWKATPEELADG